MSASIEAHVNPLKPLVIQFQHDATQPTVKQLERLHAHLRLIFPGRDVVLLPYGLEVAPGCQDELLRIGQKLDALIGALTIEGEDDQEAPATSLDGVALPGERDQSQSLG